MTRIEVRSKVGPDGVLTLSLPLGPAEAGAEVRVVVEPVAADVTGPAMTREEWLKFIEETAGSITDPTFRRHEQGEYEERDPP